jgi:hypothetical protein
MDALFADLFQEPGIPEQPFITGGATRKEVYDLAARFVSCFLELEKTVPICLAAEGRDIIAAALLAASASGRVLALPHSFSARALRQMQELTGFNTAIVDVHRELSTEPDVLALTMRTHIPQHPLQSTLSIRMVSC